METRRLAVLCSHLSPSAAEAPLEASTSTTREPPNENDNDNDNDNDNGGGCTQDGCVFCRIVRGEAPAFKVTHPFFPFTSYCHNSISHAISYLFTFHVKFKEEPQLNLL